MGFEPMTSVIPVQRSWYHRGHGFKFCTGLKIFSGLISTTSSVLFLAVRISYIHFFTVVQVYEFLISKIMSS